MTALHPHPLVTEEIDEQRRLAAIVFTDVVGFSRLAEEDEQKALNLVRRDLKLIAEICESLGGSALKNTGDGLLMCFSSAEAAVSCALRVQKAFTDAPRRLPPGEVLQHRIGIHLGDVFVSSCDVAGNDVNIANRLLGQAEPNGICISQTVYDVVKSKAGLKTTYLGPVELKNIREHIPVYKLLLLAEEGREHEIWFREPVHGSSPAARSGDWPSHSAPRKAKLSLARRLFWYAAAVTIVALGVLSVVPLPLLTGPKPLAIPGAPLDLLPVIDPARDAHKGPWQVRDGELFIASRDNNNVLFVPVVPRGDYQLEVSFTRLEGESDVVLYLPAPTLGDGPPKRVTMHFGYNKTHDLLLGNLYVNSALSGKNGQRFDAVATVRALRDKDQRSKAVAEEIQIDVTLNGNPPLSARIPLETMAPFSPAWDERGRKDVVGLGADNISVRFHTFRLNMLNGHAARAK